LDQSLNPDFHGWNHVLLNYCSSDGWTGDAFVEGDERDYYFYGWNIAKAIFEDLQDSQIIPAPNLAEAREALITGSSAGGAGAAQNLDRLAQGLPGAQVKGVVDSTWTHPYPPHKLPAGSEQEAIMFQNRHVDADCGAANLGNEGACFTHSLLYPYLQTAVFTYRDQIDQRILESYGVTDPRDPDQRAWLMAYVPSVRESLEVLDAVFSPHVGGHTALANERFYSLEVEGHTFAELLGNWYFGRSGPVKAIDYSPLG
jgi:hypothetical protein